MGISLAPEHVKRYKDIAALFVKYGRSDLLKGAGLEEAISPEPASSASDAAVGAQLAEDLEKMGPTFVKIGQLLSTRADLLPLPFMEALTRLQDKVGPFPFLEVEAIVTSELGVRLTKAFSEFDPVPVAAASLGQVHRAAMRDGRPVAVKVQRPNIREQILKDFEALEQIATFADAHTEAGKKFCFSLMLREFRKSLLRELDYRLEGRNLETLAENLAEFDRIVVPLPIEDYTTSRVLTIDYVRGEKITKLSPLVRTEFDGEELAEQLFRAYLKQILVDGFVHADPHPGNVFLTDDNRVALLDLGMVARISPGMQDKLLRLLLAVAEGHSEEAATVSIQIGDVQPGFDETGFRRDVADLVAQNLGATVGQIQVGRVVLMLSRMSAERGIRVPPELTMLGKTLLNLDQVGRTLDPDFDPNAAIRSYASELMRHRFRKSISPGNLFMAMIDARDFLEKLPRRINRILDLLASNRLEVKVDALDERTLMEGFTKIANRITMGLVLAALIVGAAQLMQVQTSFRIVGYPGLAILLFVAAAAGGGALVIDIFLADRKHRVQAEETRTTPQAPNVEL